MTYPADPDASRTILVQDDITTNKRLRVFQIQGTKDPVLGSQNPVFVSSDIMMSDSLSSWNDAFGTKYKIHAHDIDAEVLAVNNIHSNEGNTVHINSRTQMTANLTMTSGNKIKTSMLAGLDEGGDIEVETPINVETLKVQTLNPIDADHHQLYLTGYDYIDFGNANILGTGGNGWPAGAGGGSGGFQQNETGYLVDDDLNL